MAKKKGSILLLLIPLLFLLFLSDFFPNLLAADIDGLYVIKARSIETVTQGKIENGMILIRDGIIQEIGKNISVPPGAEIISADSFYVYPGFIDAHSSLAIKLPKSESQQSGTRRQFSAGIKFSPEQLAYDLLNPSDTKIKSAREKGISTVLSIPERGIFIGRSALINLNDGNKNQMVLKSPVALHIGYDRGSGYPSTLMGIIAFQRQSFYDALYHQNLLQRFEKRKSGFKRPEKNPALEVLIQALDRKLPVIIKANRENEIKRAIKLAKQFNLNYMLSGVTEGWRVVDLLKKNPVPLIINLNYPRPENVTGYSFKLKVEGPEESKPQKRKKKEKQLTPEEKEIYSNPFILYKNGLKFAFSSLGLKSYNEFLPNIRKAIDQGLPEDAALEALTINPANFFGINEMLGSLESGKIANLIISDKPIFEENASIRYILVDGKKFEIEKKPAKKSNGKAPENISGNWDVTVVSPDGEVPVTLIIQQSGNTIEGKLQSQLGEADIYDGKITGNVIQFSVKLPVQGMMLEMVFTGEISGNTIEGTIDLGEMGTAEWTAKKPGFFEIVNN